jgi:hypothetical protein
MIQMNHILVLSQDDFVGRQVQAALGAPQPALGGRLREWLRALAH